MRILFGVALILLTTISSAHVGPTIFIREIKFNPVIDLDELPEKNEAITQFLLVFPALIGANISIIDPQKVSFHEIIDGFAKPNEKVWVIGTKNQTTSVENLYLVNLSTGRAIMLCSNRLGILRECS